MRLIEELDNSGNVVARYTEGKRVDEPLAELRQGATSYYEQDGLGSVTSLSNSSGALANTYTYDSFGKLTASTGTITNPFQYEGRELDQETGIYYNRARYLDPNVGRFGTRGPIRLDAYRASPCPGSVALSARSYGPDGVPMTEFKVARNHVSDPGRERNIRLITWGVVLVMSGITLFAVYDAHSASPQLVRALGWLTVVIVIAAIVGAQFLAARLGLEKFEHDLAFVLTDKEVVRRRQGWPDVRIGLAEIKALYQRPGWLVVESKEPRRTMAIPERVEGFESLRTELTKHRPITAAPQRSPWRLITLVGSVLCWGLVLLSKDTGVVMGAGAAALVLLAWESFRLFGQLRHSPKRSALSLLIGLSWVAAALLVYLRIIRAS